jgi:RTX calcium-binding nonapeptide repeat (4 copies)
MRPSGSRRGHHWSGLIAWRVPVGLVLALILAPASSTALAAEAAVVDGRLVVTAGDDPMHILDVTPTGLAYEIYDARDEVTAGEGCVQRTLHQVYCTSFVLELEVRGGAGDDLIGLWDVPVPVRVHGGAGDDLLESGSGPDTLEGGGGTDGLVGGGGEDTLVGGDGADLLSGNAAADTLQAGAGADVVEGGAGSNDILLGGEDADLLRGGEGGDRLEGDEGEDSLVGGPGRDEVDGGPAADLVFDVSGRRDKVRCEGRDRVRSEGRLRMGCTQLASRVRAPRVWPPDPKAQAAQGPDRPDVDAWPRRKGAARRTTVWIQTIYHERVRVRVRSSTRSGRALRRFRKVVHTRTPHTFSHPRPGRRAWRVRARLP